jgi:hypothetical protein
LSWLRSLLRLPFVVLLREHLTGLTGLLDFTSFDAAKLLHGLFRREN